MTQDEAHRLALALEGLRGTVETGFATVRGDINLLARGEAMNVRETQELDARVSALEARRFPLPTIGGIMGVAGAVFAGLSLVKGG